MNLEELENKINELQEELKKMKNEKSKNKRWRAEKGEAYYYLREGFDYCVYEDEDKVHDYRYLTRNYFKTVEQAREYAEKIKTYYKLMDIAEELNQNREINWREDMQYKYHIVLKNKQLELKEDIFVQEIGQIYCLDGDFLNVAIRKIGKTRLKELFEED